MIQINCSVCNCSHNKSNTCYSNIVNIGGGCANNISTTCCGNFLDSKNYSNLTNNTNSNGPCDSLVCSVESCVYNRDKSCIAETINVNGNDVKIYSETNCSTFKHK